MKTLTIKNINNNSEFTINAENCQKGMETKSIYVRLGYMNGNLFISQRGNGAGGRGDICKCSINENTIVSVKDNLYDRLNIWANKYNLIQA